MNNKSESFCYLGYYLEDKRRQALYTYLRQLNEFLKIVSSSPSWETTEYNGYSPRQLKEAWGAFIAFTQNSAKIFPHQSVFKNIENLLAENKDNSKINTQMVSEELKEFLKYLGINTSGYRTPLFHLLEIMSITKFHINYKESSSEESATENYYKSKYGGSKTKSQSVPDLANNATNFVLLMYKYIQDILNKSNIPQSNILQV